MSGYEVEENIKLIEKFIKDFSEFGKKSYFAKKNKLYQSNLSSHIRQKKFSPKIHKLIQEFYSMSTEEQKTFSQNLNKLIQLQQINKLIPFLK
jgi:hypothetical protein